MAEFTQFTLSNKAKDVADRLVSDGWFSSANEAGIFAAAYAIKYHFNDVNPLELKYANTTHNYGYSSFDPDGSWETIMENLYKTETPRLCFKNLIIWGLEAIGDQIEKEGILQITDYI